MNKEAANIKREMKKVFNDYYKALEIDTSDFEFYFNDKIMELQVHDENDRFIAYVEIGRDENDELPAYIIYGFNGNQFVKDYVEPIISEEN